METSHIKKKVFDEMENVASHDIIVNARYLNDEQLIHSEQLQVLEEIFNANVRDTEIRMTVYVDNMRARTYLRLQAYSRNNQ